MTESGDGSQLRELLARIARTSGCTVLPPSGTPTVQPGHVIPPDLGELHRLCGGAWLFEDRPYRWRLSGPGDLTPASPRLLTHEVALEVSTSNPEDLTHGCYVIADGGGATTDPHIVIDLHPSRTSRCYLVGWDTYGVVGDMPTIATSVTELLSWLLATEGTELPATPVHGDAYNQP